MAINKSLQDITEGDLQALVDNKVEEGKTFEYKESLDNTDRGKRKFLEGVSSLANAMGGDLIFGIRAKEGIATEVCGLAGIDHDQVILGLESLIQQCIKPRVPGVYMGAIRLANSNTVIIVRVHKSWAVPHVVQYQKHWRFYSRNSRGKYPMDIQELREAFLLSDTTIEKIRKFRAERVQELFHNNFPIKIDVGPEVVLHIIPINAFTPGVRCDISTLYPHRHDLIKEWTDNVGCRYNFDGFLVYPPLSQESYSTYAYAQFYRNGIIEALEASHTITLRDDGIIIPYWYENRIIKLLRNFMKFQKLLKVEPPLILMLSLIRVPGFKIRLPRGVDIRQYPTDRSLLLLPEVIIETFEDNLPQAFKEVFDMVWNAAGVSHSLNYNGEGNWRAGDT